MSPEAIYDQVFTTESDVYVYVIDQTLRTIFQWFIDDLLPHCVP